MNAGLVLLLAACGSAEGGAAREQTWQQVCAAHLGNNRFLEPARVGFVFVDRSASVRADSAVVRAFADTVQAVAQEVLQAPGSQLWMLPVHSRTTSRADALPLRLEAGDTPQVANEIEANIRARCAAFVEGLDRDRDTLVRMAKDAVGRLLHAPAADVSRATDLWGVLEVLTELAPRDTAAASRPIRVVVLSDLLECMPGPQRRCFETHAPSSREEAERWGRADTAAVRRLYRIDPAVLKRLDISFVSAGLAMREQNRYVTAYWRALLEALGVPSERIHTQ